MDGIGQRDEAGARLVARWEVADIAGAVVAVALSFKDANPHVLAMGEDRGRRPAPVRLLQLAGRGRGC